MDLELEGRIGLVTGASTGIGRAIAQTMAAEAIQLVLVARRKSLLYELSDQIADSGGARPLVIVLDLTVPDAANQLQEKVLAKFGKLDILVNNAGAGLAQSVSASEEDWERAIRLNFTAVRTVTHSFLPTMQKLRWGRVINVTPAQSSRSSRSYMASMLHLRDGQSVSGGAAPSEANLLLPSWRRATRFDQDRFLAPLVAHSPVPSADPDIQFSNRSRSAAGPLVLNVPDAGRPIDEALRAIRTFINERGSDPNQRSWTAAAGACERTIRARFGSFAAAVRAARSGTRD